MTNYEHIKNMSVERLAHLSVCPNEAGLAKIPCDLFPGAELIDVDDLVADIICYECCLNWLQSECEAEPEARPCPQCGGAERKDHQCAICGLGAADAGGG